MATSKLAVAVRALPEGATVCGWCAEFEDAARRSSDLVRENDEMRRKNERLRRQTRENTSEEVEKLQADLDYARRDWKYAHRFEASFRHPFACPLCAWIPKDEAPHPLRSMQAHLHRAHRAKKAVPKATAGQEDV